MRNSRLGAGGSRAHIYRNVAPPFISPTPGGNGRGDTSSLSLRQSGPMPADNVIRLKATRPCPICGKPSSQADHPFCSPRCADIDLNRWLSGAYVIPGRDPGAADDERDDSDALPQPDDSDDV